MAANAIARRCGDRWPTACSKYDIAPLRMPFVVSDTGGCPERPDAASPTVLDAAAAVPPPVGAPAVADPAGDALGVGQEPEAHPPEFGQLASGVRLSDDGDQQPRHVVGAISLLASRFGVIGMLEDPDRVAHRQHVAPRRKHHPSGCRHQWRPRRHRNHALT
jgi:hypothetical protein